MRLLSAYIENFGRLSDVSLDFSTGFNQLVADNGSGKTTFMAFLGAMLYGMPAGTKTNPQENPRRHYAPWQGGRYGGSLTFSHEGRRYTVSRLFGDKESRDVFTLFDADTELASEDFPPALGEALFGVDAESFEKSASVPSFEKDRFGGKGSTIAERLSSYVEESEGALSYEKAYDILEKQRKVYIKTGNKGLLPETEEAIEQTRLCLMRAERDQATAEELQQSITRLEERRAHLLKEEESLSALLFEEGKAESGEALRRHGAALAARLSALSDECRRAEASFRGRLPEEAELLALEKEAILLESDDVRGESPAEKEELSALDRIFGGSLPTDEALLALAAAEQKEKGKEKGEAEAWAFMLAGVIFGLLGAAFAFVFPILDLFFFPLCVLCFIPFYRSRRRKETPPDSLRYRELLSMRERYRSLLSAQKEASRLSAEREEKRARLLALADSFGESSGELPARFRAVRQRVEAYRRLLADVKEADALYRAFACENEAVLKQAVTRQDEGAEARRLRLRTELKEVEDALEAERRRVLPIKEHAAKREEYRLQIERLTEKAAEYRRHSVAIERAEKLLTAARDTLSLRYLADMQASFDRYAARFLPDFRDTPVLSGDLALKVKSGSTRVSPLYYSDGVQDILSFCMHISLADALFKDAKPPLFFDDSFATWDDSRMQEGLRFLRERAEDQQVFYFTCQSARADKEAKNLSLS